MGTRPASENPFPEVLLSEVAAPASAPSGKVRLYAKSDGLLYWKDDAGTEYPVSSSSGAPALDDLSDVNAPTPADGDRLTWDDGAGEWVPAAASGGGLSHSYIGYNTVGGSTENAQARIRLKKVTLASDGLLTSIGIYVKQVNTNTVTSIAVACLTDSAGSPTNLIGQSVGLATNGLFLATSGAAAGAARWVHTPLGLWLPAGDYWLSVLIDSSSDYQVYKDGSGSDRYYTPSAFRMSDAGWTTVTTSSDKYSIRGSFLS